MLWNSVQTFMVPRWWILVILVIPWLFISCYHEANIYDFESWKCVDTIIDPEMYVFNQKNNWEPATPLRDFNWPLALKKYLHLVPGTCPQSSWRGVKTTSMWQLYTLLCLISSSQWWKKYWDPLPECKYQYSSVKTLQYKWKSCRKNPTTVKVLQYYEWCSMQYYSKSSSLYYFIYS